MKCICFSNPPGVGMMLYYFLYSFLKESTNVCHQHRDIGIHEGASKKNNTWQSRDETNFLFYLQFIYFFLYYYYFFSLIYNPLTLFFCTAYQVSRWQCARLFHCPCILLEHNSRRILNNRVFEILGTCLLHTPLWHVIFFL